MHYTHTHQLDEHAKLVGSLHELLGGRVVGGADPVDVHVAEDLDVRLPELALRLGILQTAAPDGVGVVAGGAPVGQHAAVEEDLVADNADLAHANPPLVNGVLVDRHLQGVEVRMLGVPAPERVVGGRQVHCQQHALLLACAQWRDACGGRGHHLAVQQQGGSNNTRAGGSLCRVICHRYIRRHYRRLVPCAIFKACADLDGEGGYEFHAGPKMSFPLRLPYQPHPQRGQWGL